MIKKEKLALAENRLNVLLGRGDKNIKAGGVVRKLRREIRKLQG